MTIYFKCEGCGKVLNVPDGREGRLIECATCGRRMRVPTRPPPKAAEPAPPAAAETPPPSAAPATEGLAQDKAAFFRALIEETEREQRQAAAAKAAREQAEAELTPLSEPLAGGSDSIAVEGARPPTPAKPPAVPPASGGTPEEKDALFDALAEEVAREQREMDYLKPAPTRAEAGRAPSPEGALRGRSAAATELRVKSAADKAGYALAGAAPPPPPPSPEERPSPTRKPLGAAVGLLLLILLIIGTWLGLSSKKPPPKAEPTVSAPAPFAPPTVKAPGLPAALKEADAALADKALVEVEVDETGAEAAAPQIPILTPTGDLMLDLTNLHIRDKSDADVSLQEMRSAIRSAVNESVTAQLREKGLTLAEAGGSAAAKPDEAHSRLKVLIRASPAWAAFDFRGAPPAGESAPVQPIRPPRFRPPFRRSRETQLRLRGVPLAPMNPVKFWERLSSEGLTVNARFGAGMAQNWSATAADDPQADLLPCGLRVSIVRLAWEVGEREHDLIGLPGRSDTTLLGEGAEASASGGQAGVAVPFQRPKKIREIQLTGRMGPGRTCLISGFCQYEDVDLRDGAGEAGKLVASYLVAPEADWNTFWEGKAGRESLAAACRNILRLDGGPAIAERLTAEPDELPSPSADVLAAVLEEKHGNPDWALPFLTLKGPCGDAALIGLARQPKAENEKYFLEWVGAPANHSPESVQAACCALIDLGRPSPELDDLIDKHAVGAFSEVRSPSACLAFPPQTAQTVLDWLIRNGTDSQWIGAVAAVVDGNIEKLHDTAREFVSQSLRSDPETICSLCKGIEKSRSPLAFEILSAVAQRQLMQSDAGDRFLPPADLFNAGGTLPTGRYSRTVAALVCAGLARFDRFEAGKVLARLMGSPGPATRYCAIETLIALDDVDVSPDIRARLDQLNRQERDAYEQQEWELLNSAKNRLCRYDVPLLSAKNAVENGINLKGVVETCNGIIGENPSPAVVERARELKRQAEKLLEHK
jgi:DNA-directed RNA polymerase subunit RPC12/RpoP